MSFIITADIRGVKYYLKVGMRLDVPAHKYDYTYRGLKNHASKYDTIEVAEATKSGLKSRWELKVESY